MTEQWNISNSREKQNDTYMSKEEVLGSGQESVGGDGILQPSLEAEEGCLLSGFTNGMEVSAGKGLSVTACVWMAGVLLLGFYTVCSYFFLKYKYRGIWQKGDTIIISEQIKTPFAAGLFHPVIFLPAGLEREQQSLIIAHEKVHIQRKDSLIKLVYFAALCIHWFNPLVWFSFYLMEQDMEVSCDEAVLSRAGMDQKKLYAKTLLLFSHSYEMINVCPIAFGENSTKVRIKNVVKMKGATPRAMVLGSVIVVLAAGMLLVNNAKKEEALPEKVVVEENLGIQEADEMSVQEEKQEVKLLEEEAGKLQAQEETVEKLVQEETMEAEKAVLAEKQEQLLEEQKQIEAEIRKAKEQAEQNVALLEEHNEPEKTDVYRNILRNVEGIYNEVGIFYQNPVPGAKLSETYGDRIHPVTGEELFHSGMDLVAEKGTMVLAAAKGKVYETGYDKNAGNYLILLHINGEMTYYANCDTILVESGQEVEAGEQIATLGSTGSSTGAHLHFALSYQGSFIEPVITEK
jgi:murein DD-endopeptidase MepM/ murein hydrolase activator NlpD